MKLAPERIALLKAHHELFQERRQRGLHMPQSPCLLPARRLPVMGRRGPLKPAVCLPQAWKMRVLAVLREQGPLTIKELAEACPGVDVRNAVYDRCGLRRKGLVKHTQDGKLAAV